jgi:hypothetical protein
MINAETTINGAGVAGEYSYLFAPATSDAYAFTVSSGQDADLSVATITGSASSYGPGVWGLSAPGLYLVKLDLDSANQAFQFRVDPVTTADLAGTIDFTSLPSFGGGVTVDSVGVAVYADNNAHTPLETGSPTVALINGVWTWSTSVYLTGATPAVIVIDATLSNTQHVFHQEYLAINGDTDGLKFTPKAITGSGPVFRTTFGYADQLLYVPAKPALYSFRASVAGDMGLTLYDAVTTGPSLADSSGSGEVEITASLIAGHPYRIQVSSAPSTSVAYQFRAEELADVTLKGTVNFAGLAALTGGINRTEIQVYDAAGAKLGSPASVNKSTGAWTATLPPASNQTVMIAASVYLNNNRQVNCYLGKPITRFGAEDIVLAPIPTTTATVGKPWHDIAVYAGNEGTWLLWIPEMAGIYALDTVRTGNPMENPSMVLYDGITGAQIAADDNGGGGFDSRIQRSFAAGHPYLARVTETYGAGTFKFRALPPLTMSGTVNFAGLAPLTVDDISYTDIQVYNVAGAKLGSATAGSDGAWTAIVSPALTAQTVRIVASVHLKKGGQIDSFIEETIQADSLTKDTLALVPTFTASDTEHTVYADSSGTWRTWLLWIPATAGEYLLDTEETDGKMDTHMTLYDGRTGAQLAYDDNGGEESNSRIRHSGFEAGQPYLIQVKNNNNVAGTFRFKVKELAPVTLSGTINFAGLNPLTGANISRTEIQVYDDSTNLAKLESPVTAEGNGAWTATVPFALTAQTIRITASVYLNNGGLQIDSHRAETIQAEADLMDNLDFAPTAIGSEAWHDSVVYAGSSGASLLWIPSATGKYTLAAERTDGSMDPYLYIYDAITGDLLGSDDNGGGNTNSRIQRDFEEDYPYMVRVTAKSGVGTFRFRALAVAP